MGEESLSQAERASLLGTVAQPTGQAAGLDRKAIPPKSRPKPAAGDGKQHVSPELLRVLQSLHEAVARDFATALSALLRGPVAVQLANMDQVTFAEFLRGLASPTCLQLFSGRPLQGMLALDISPSLIFPMLDRLLGGSYHGSQPAQRPLTEIERRLAARVTGPFVDAMSRAWRAHVEIDFELLRIETNPQAVRLVSASELVVLVGMEVLIGELRGLVSLCMPWAVLAPLRDRLLGVPQVASGTIVAEPHLIPLPMAATATGVLTVELAQVQIAASELDGLRVGDIITTDRHVQSPFTISIDGQPRFVGHPGALQGRKAICIDAPIVADTSPGQ